MLPYVPNPSRFFLFYKQSDFEFFYPDFRRKIIEKLGEIRKEYLIEISKLFSVTTEQLNTPLIVNYIQTKTNKAKDALSYALELRNSKGAQAFRRYCRIAENSKDLAFLMEVKQEVEQFENFLKKDLKLRDFRRKINIRKCGIDSIELPDSVKKYDIKVNLLYNLIEKFGISTIPDHFIFLHDLVRCK